MLRDLVEPFSHQAQRFSPDDPYERCGFLWSRRFGSPISLNEEHNTHVNAANNFRILSRQYDDAVLRWLYSRKVGRDVERAVVGIWHTHPGRDRDTWFPSTHDLAEAVKWPHLVHAVYHPFTRRLTFFAAEGIRESFHLKARWVTRKGI